MVSMRNFFYIILTCLCSLLGFAFAETSLTEAQARDFLVKHMPQSDKVLLNDKLLKNNIKYALKAKERFPWSKKIPQDIFLNDVLPYASLNERRDDWREDFYQRFSPIVTDAETIEQAVALISKNIQKELKVVYSTKRKKPDQSPYESMEQGMASCTGLSILLVNACRSVGIPARVVGTPAWTTKNGNHNWVEIYTPSDNKWHFTEYYRDEKGLDAGWFVNDAKRANPKSEYHRIYASSWKKTKLHFPLVWDIQDTSVSAVDVTKHYTSIDGGIDIKANSCELRIEFIENKHRVAKKVTLKQGTDEIGNGTTPKQTDDANHFLSFTVQKGQIYYLTWKNKDQLDEYKVLHIPKDKAYFKVEIMDTKLPEKLEQFLNNVDEFTDKSFASELQHIQMAGFRPDPDFTCENESLYYASCRINEKTYHLSFTISPQSSINDRSKYSDKEWIQKGKIIEYKVKLDGKTIAQLLKTNQ